MSDALERCIALLIESIDANTHAFNLWLAANGLDAREAKAEPENPWDRPPPTAEELARQEAHMTDILRAYRAGIEAMGGKVYYDASPSIDPDDGEDDSENADEDDPREARIAELEARVADLAEQRQDELRAKEKAEARVAELERENAGLRLGMKTWQDKWDHTETAREKAEAALAELRGRVEKAVGHIQRTADRIANRDDMPYGDRDFRELRGSVRAAVLLLIDPEAKEGGGPDNDGRSDAHQPVDRGDIAQPARDTDPVPATDAASVHEQLRERTALRYMADCKCGKCQLVPRELIDRTLKVIEALATARAAGITGKGTSDE